jgi:hypothetical protein
MSELNPAIVAGTRIAVDFLRVLTEQDLRTAAPYLGAILDDPNGPGAYSIIVGQLAVGKVLVMMLAQERGAVTPDDLRARRSEILRELHRYLLE